MIWGDTIGLLIFYKYSQKHEEDNHAKIQFNLCFFSFSFTTGLAHKQNWFLACEKKTVGAL